MAKPAFKIEISRFGPSPPVKISFKGSVRHAANWFDLLGIELPHAQVRDVRIESDESTKENTFAVSLYYRYRQSAMGGSI